MSTTIPADHPSSNGTLERLVTAWGESKPYVLTGVATGVILVVVAKLIEVLPPKDGTLSSLGRLANLASSLIEHLGMGFIVAAIAVLFYEWGAHIKDAVAMTTRAVEVTGKLEKNVEGVSSTVQNLQVQTAKVGDLTASAQEILQRLDEMNDPVVEQALTATLHRAFRGKDDEEIVQNLVTFVRSVKDLEERGDWAKEGYIPYLGALLSSATNNADSLCKLSTQLKREKDPRSVADYRVEVYSPAVLTDIMLAEQMKRLPQGGKYSVVSNVGSWQGEQLSALHIASEKAVREKGVQVRRIFVAGDRAAHRYHATADDAREVLTRHLEASKDWIPNVGNEGFYHVKLLDRTAMKDIMSRIPEAFRIYEKHFGVFQRPGEAHCVRVEVTSPNLADLKIAGLDLGSGEIRSFEAVWNALSLLTDSLLKDALERWE